MEEVRVLFCRFLFPGGGRCGGDVGDSSDLWFSGDNGGFWVSAAAWRFVSKAVDGLRWWLRRTMFWNQKVAAWQRMECEALGGLFGSNFLNFFGTSDIREVHGGLARQRL